MTNLIRHHLSIPKSLVVLMAATDDELQKLGRPPIYSGKEDEWNEWSFVMRNYVSLLSAHIPALLAGAEDTASPDMSTILAEINSNDFCHFVFNSSNSNRILSSRELIILSDSNFCCFWGSCAVCCGLFSHEARHTARTQHSTGTQSTVK